MFVNRPTRLLPAGARPKTTGPVLLVLHITLLSHLTPPFFITSLPMFPTGTLIDLRSMTSRNEYQAFSYQSHYIESPPKYCMFITYRDFHQTPREESGPHDHIASQAITLPPTSQRLRHHSDLPLAVSVTCLCLQQCACVLVHYTHAHLCQLSMLTGEVQQQVSRSLSKFVSLAR